MEKVWVTYQFSTNLGKLLVEYANDSVVSETVVLQIERGNKKQEISKISEG